MELPYPLERVISRLYRKKHPTECFVVTLFTGVKKPPITINGEHFESLRTRGAQIVRYCLLKI